MLGGLSMCELSDGDERQQYGHDERARWNVNKFTGCHQIWGTKWIQSNMTDIVTEVGTQIGAAIGCVTG